MKSENTLNRDLVYRILIGVVALAILVVVCIGIFGKDDTPTVPDRVEVATPTVKVEVVEVEKEKLVEVEVEKVITAEILQDGLRDMGTLITGEYYFTEVVDYSSVKTFSTFWGSQYVVPGSESSYTVSYDGVVTAGIDFSRIAVNKDDARHTITVTLPAAEIQTVDIDPTSFRLHSEKQSIINQTSVADFNDSLVELEANARAKATERDLLTRADENAQQIVRNFIRSLVDTNTYTVTCITH